MEAKNQNDIPDLILDWAIGGTSVLGGVYYINNMMQFQKYISRFVQDDGHFIDTRPTSLKDGDFLVVCTENMLDDDGRIWFGRCEYVVMDEVEGKFIPRQNGKFRTYDPIEMTDAMADVTYMGTINDPRYNKRVHNNDNQDLIGLAAAIETIMKRAPKPHQP